MGGRRLLFGRRPQISADPSDAGSDEVINLYLEQLCFDYVLPDNATCADDVTPADPADRTPLTAEDVRNGVGADARACRPFDPPSR